MSKNPGTHSASVPLSRYSRQFRASLTGHNGTPHQASVEDRIGRVEELVEKLQDALEIQFARTATIQAELDALRGTLGQ